MLMAAFLATSCGEQHIQEQASAESALPMSVTSAGFTVSLEDIVFHDDGTTLALRIADAEPEVGPAIWQFDGIFTPLDVNLKGISLATSNNLGSINPVRDPDSTTTPPTIVAFEMDMRLGAPKDEVQEVTVTINRLHFTPDQPGELQPTVEGNWSFTFDPEAVTQTSKRVVVNRNSEADGITLVIDEVRIFAEETEVTYRIKASGTGRVEGTELVARLPNRELVVANRIETRDDTFIAHFEQLPDVKTVDLILPAVLAEVAEPLTITLPVTNRQPLDERRTLIQVDKTLELAGDSLTIADIEVTEDEFSIRAANQSINKHGRVLLRMPHADFHLTDDLGTEYQPTGATTNFSKADPITMWANSSTFSFAGQIPVTATQLILKLEGYAVQLGPWEVPVDFTE